jgi:hypothetical protein
MIKLHVLVDKHGNVLGTFRADQKGSGPNAPSLGVRARPDQRLVEMEVDERLAVRDPAELHEEIKARLPHATRVHAPSREG